MLCRNCVAFSMLKPAFSSSWLLCCAAAFVLLNDQGIGCIGQWYCFFMAAMMVGILIHILSVQFVLCTLFGVQCRLRLKDLPWLVLVRANVVVNLGDGCCVFINVSFSLVLDRVCSSFSYVVDFSSARGFGIVFRDLGGSAMILFIGDFACHVCWHHSYDRCKEYLLR